MIARDVSLGEADGVPVATTNGVFVADTMLAKCASKYEKETAAGVQISKKSN